MQADIRQCTMCKKPFQTFGGRFCGDCLEKIDNDFITIREYIYDNPKTKIGVPELVENTGVTKEVIMHLIRENRLILDGTSAMGCASCGKPIAKGTYCDACRDKLVSTLDSTLPAGNDEKADKKKSNKSYDKTGIKTKYYTY